MPAGRSFATPPTAFAMRGATAMPPTPARMVARNAARPIGSPSRGTSRGRSREPCSCCCIPRTVGARTRTARETLVRTSTPLGVRAGFSRPVDGSVWPGSSISARALLVLCAPAAPAALADPADVSVTISGTLQQTHTDSARRPPADHRSSRRRSGPQAVTLRRPASPCRRAAPRSSSPGGSRTTRSRSTRRRSPVRRSSSRRPGAAGGAQPRSTPGAVRKIAVVLISFSAPGLPAPALLGRALSRTCSSPARARSRTTSPSRATARSRSALRAPTSTASTIAANGSGCNDDGTSWHNPGWMTWGSQAATAAGLARSPYGTYTGYDHVIFVFNSHGTLRLGRVSATCPATRSTSTTPSPLPVVAHELGHNLGVHHASTLRCVAGGQVVAFSSTDSACASNEYGDPFDVMGSSQTPNHRTRSTSCSPAGSTRRRARATITESGSYTSRPLEASSGVSLLLVPHVTAGTESNAPSAPVGSCSPSTSGSRAAASSTPSPRAPSRRAASRSISCRRPARLADPDAADRHDPGDVDVRRRGADGGLDLRRLHRRHHDRDDRRQPARRDRAHHLRVGRRIGGRIERRRERRRRRRPRHLAADRGAEPHRDVGERPGRLALLRRRHATTGRSPATEISRDGIQIDSLSGGQTTYADWGTTSARTPTG